MAAKKKLVDAVQAWRDAVKAWRSAAPRAGTLGARECLDVANNPLRDDAKRLLICARALLKSEGTGPELAAALKKVGRIIDAHHGVLTPGTDSAVAYADQLVDVFDEVRARPDLAPALPNIETQFHKRVLNLLQKNRSYQLLRDVADGIYGANLKLTDASRQRLLRALRELRAHGLVQLKPGGGRGWGAVRDN